MKGGHFGEDIFVRSIMRLSEKFCSQHILTFTKKIIKRLIWFEIPIQRYL